LKSTAFHESGHAVVSLNMPGSRPLHKVTVIPRGEALGANFFLPERDEYHFSKSFLLGQIAISYGGRLAEELFLTDVCTGASNDIQQASGLARKMVTEWGMSEKLGMGRYTASEERMFMGGEITRSKSFSEETARIIDEEIMRIQKECYERARIILQERGEAVARLAENLMIYETLSGDEVRIICEG
ncbi:MAG: cell division protein FtsH, partial [Planctomycetes bacterium]|nr:cell division protein FtsH [Planctomycetota bacterium]